jgi:hypothetical protein
VKATPRCITTKLLKTLIRREMLEKVRDIREKEIKNYSKLLVRNYANLMTVKQYLLDVEK